MFIINFTAIKQTIAYIAAGYVVMTISTHVAAQDPGVKLWNCVTSPIECISR